MQCEEVDLIGFLNSGLSAAETSTVAEHLERCGDCHDRLRLLLEMRRNQAELQRLKERRRQRFYAWPVAAALALAGLLAYWLVVTPADVAKLAVMTPYPLVPPQLRSPRAPDSFIVAAQAYADNNWPEAEQQFRLLLAQRPDDYEVAFYLANVLYVQNRLAESGNALAGLARRNPEDNRVRWYLGNLRLRQRDVAAAREHLEWVARNSGEFQREAASLLRKLPR